MKFARILVSLAWLFPTALACSGATPPAGGGGEGGQDPGPTLVSCEEDADCDDYLFCTGEERCQAGSCVRGSRVRCDDGIACTLDICSESERSCVASLPDSDGDGHFDASCVVGDVSGDDCDDADPDAFPGNVEVCDTAQHDEDCDPTTLGGRDNDRDGYEDSACCNPGAEGELICGEDCNDFEPSVNPEGTEVCDSFDNNCDGRVDEGVSVTLYRDRDHDGRGEDEGDSSQKCPGTVGYALRRGDCDDDDPEVFEGQFEICDNKDNDCNGATDEREDQAPWFEDADEDGYGDASSSPVFSCYRLAGRVLSSNDCNDQDGKINPNAPEVCDGVDNDCNLRADFVLGVNDFEDDDGDGVADASCAGGLDCDDHDRRTAGGAEEVCDKVDNDCDGLVDEQTVQNIWYIDEDGDGFGVVVGSALASCEPISGRATEFGDCNDGARDVRPGAAERCDGYDNDCDGSVDEGASVDCKLSGAIATCALGRCAILACQGGFADLDSSPENGCEAPLDEVIDEEGSPCQVDGDCDDGNLCTGQERCLGGFCQTGSPVFCGSGPGIIQGSVFVRSAQDVHGLKSIERITGDLIIENSTLQSLVGLESLRFIGGSLFVRNNPRLRRLSGSALSNLEVVGGDIGVYENAELISADLPSLVSARSLEILGNASLEVLSGFENLQSVRERIEVSNNPLLGEMTGFGRLSNVGGAYVPSCDGPDYCESCGRGGVLVIGNQVLQDFSAFESLTGVGGDVCLEDIEGLLRLPKLSQVGETLRYQPGPSESGSELELPVLSRLGAFQVAVYGESYEPIRRISSPKLEAVEGAFRIEFAHPSLDELDFGALETVGDLSVSFYAGEDREVRLALEALSFPSLEKARDIDIVLDGLGLGSVELPALTAADSLRFSAIQQGGSDSSLRVIAAPKLERAESVDISGGSLVWSALERIDFRGLRETDRMNVQMTVAGPRTSSVLRLDALEVVGLSDNNQDTKPDNAGDLALCTGSAVGQGTSYENASCAALSAIVERGYVGQASSCGQCPEEDPNGTGGSPGVGGGTSGGGTSGIGGARGVGGATGGGCERVSAISLYYHRNAGGCPDSDGNPAGCQSEAPLDLGFIAPGVYRITVEGVAPEGPNPRAAAWVGYTPAVGVGQLLPQMLGESVYVSVAVEERLFLYTYDWDATDNSPNLITQYLIEKCPNEG